MNIVFEFMLNRNVDLCWTYRLRIEGRNNPEDHFTKIFVGKFSLWEDDVIEVKITKFSWLFVSVIFAKECFVFEDFVRCTWIWFVTKIQLTSSHCNNHPWLSTKIKIKLARTLVHRHVRQKKKKHIVWPLFFDIRH